MKEELQYSRSAEEVLLNPVTSGERVEYKIPVTNFFFPNTLNGSFPKPGDYTLWVEYIPEIGERADAPVAAKSNAVKFHVEPLNIVAEKKIEPDYLELGSDPVIRRKGYFRAFVHKGEKSNRLYCQTNRLAPFQISDNVVPEKFDMKVDQYGDLHVWYQTTAGDFFYYLHRNSLQPPPETKHIPQELKEHNWEALDVPPNHQPQFKVTEGRVTLDFIPVSQPSAGGENHQPREGGKGHQNGAGQGVSGETPPAASSFPIHLIIIAAVIIIGALAAFLIIRSQKRRAT